MDTKIQIIEEDHLPDDNASQKKIECFNKHLVKQIKYETVACSNKCKIEAKTDIGSQKEEEFPARYPVIGDKLYNSNDEMENKIEIKEEAWWLEKEALSVCDDIQDGDLNPAKSPSRNNQYRQEAFPDPVNSRLCIEAGSGISYGDSLFPSAESSGKNKSFSYGKDCAEWESQASGVPKITAGKKHLHAKQFGECDMGQNRAVTIHRVKKSHNCNICDRRFTQLSRLKLHILVHEGKKPHKCETCEKWFTRLSNLKKHNLIHEGKRPYKCEICEKNYTLLSHLKFHKLTHENKKPYACETCEKRFTQLSDLKVHKFIHENKKPYECNICEKGFIRLSNLKMHNFIHEGEKPYKCEVCEKRFSQLSDLKRHNFIHENKRPHKCEICEKRFTQLSNMKRHNLTHELKGLKSVKLVRRILVI